MNLRRIRELFDWHDLIFSVLFIFVLLQIGSCELKVKVQQEAPAAAEPAPAPVTAIQRPGRREISI